MERDERRRKQERHVGGERRSGEATEEKRKDE